MCVTTSRKRSSHERVVSAPIILLFQLQVAQNNEGLTCKLQNFSSMPLGLIVVGFALFKPEWLVARRIERKRRH
jgi:hypothetical protein